MTLHGQSVAASPRGCQPIGPGCLWAANPSGKGALGLPTHRARVRGYGRRVPLRCRGSLGAVSRARISFRRDLAACRRRTAEEPAGRSQSGPKGAPRPSPSDVALGFALAPRRSPSGCSERTVRTAAKVSDFDTTLAVRLPLSGASSVRGRSVVVLQANHSIIRILAIGFIGVTLSTADSKAIFGGSGHGVAGVGRTSGGMRGHLLRWQAAAGRGSLHACAGRQVAF